MDLEYCFECDQPTGNAGEMEDSNFCGNHPYCDECYAELPEKYLDKWEQSASKVAELEQKLSKTAHILHQGLFPRFEGLEQQLAEAQRDSARLRAGIEKSRVLFMRNVCELEEAEQDADKSVCVNYDAMFELSKEDISVDSVLNWPIDRAMEREA